LLRLRSRRDAGGAGTDAVDAPRGQSVLQSGVLMRNRLPRLLIAAALAGAAACGSSTTTPPTSPTAPATTADVFTGTLTQTGSVFHIFSVAANGSVEISLTSVAPLATMSLGLSIGSSDGTNCLTTITQNPNARSGSVALKGTATTGKYCVKV